jgi:hypothetical protein
MRLNTKMKSRKRPSDNYAQDAKASDEDMDAKAQDPGHLYSIPMDELLLKFEVNEKGVGHILLPPRLSVLLQSDRISIAPFAGGLFIRSV